MKDSLSRAFARYQRTFLAFTTGQKLIAVLGTGALLLAGFMVFRWASAPSYAPLFSNLASSDASAVIDKLNAAGTPYKISDGGTTIIMLLSPAGIVSPGTASGAARTATPSTSRIAAVP